jgi:hypothetical protein
MLKFELLKQLENFPDDATVIIMFNDGGWCNVDVVMDSGGDIAITPDTGTCFSDE